MAHTATEKVDANTAWGGDAAPYNISWGKMMMWFFLISDALTFTGFLLGYGMTRNTFAADWPNPDDVFNHFPFLSGHHPLMFVSLMTFILIMSSVTMVLAVEAGHRFDRKSVTKWLGITILGGIFFLSSQAYEWAAFITGTPEGKTIGETVIHGANLTRNEYGHQLFADFFFFITGFHGFHVLTGLIILTITFILVVNGTLQRRGHYEMVEKVGLYWHFVDLVWVFVFTFFYLI